MAKSKKPVRKSKARAKQNVIKLPPFVTHARLLAAEIPKIDWGLKLIGVENAWKVTRGAGVKVAILDTGIDLTHPDLRSGIAGAQDFTGNRFGAQDGNIHGTHCAGITGARGKLYGVAPECELYIGKVLGDDGSGEGGNIAAGIDWAVGQEVDVISMSLGSPQQDPRISAAIRRAVAAGIVLVVAAGNDGRRNSVNWPAKMDDVLAISAIGKDGNLADYSSRGPEVDFSAPGSEILSCAPGGGYATLSGTSMATPLVTGVIALGIAAMGDQFSKPRTVQQVISRLRDYVRDAGVPGKDSDYCWGVVDLTRLPTPTVPVTPIPAPAPGPSPVSPIVLNGVALEPVTLGDGRVGVFIPKAS